MLQVKNFQPEIALATYKYIDEKKKAKNIIGVEEKSESTANLQNADAKMLQIMQMVQDNSQVLLMHHMIMEIDIFRAHPLSVQLVHNTDEDSLSLLLIDDFVSFKITEVSLARLNSKNRRLLMERFGHSNQNFLTNVMTAFLSLEFRALLKEIKLCGLREQNGNIQT